VQTGQDHCLRGQGLGKQRLFVAVFQNSQRATYESFRLYKISLGNHHTGAWVIYLCIVYPVIKSGKKDLSTIKMLVRFGKSPNPAIQHSEIVFDARLMFCELGSIKIDTCGTKLD
jgi:hypothetical protein